jgi:hypothetical protein
MEVPSMADAIPLPFEPEEAWRPVVGYEGLYEVSDHGRVRRVAAGGGARVGRILRFGMSAHPGEDASKGYRTVVLYQSGKPRRFKVHLLVAGAFLGTRPAGHECNHKNGVKTNNRLSNLEWITKQANMQHAFRLGITQPIRGECHPAAKLTAAQVAEIKRLTGVESAESIAGRFGVTSHHVNRIRRGEYRRGG